ncbi:pimeloyl-ACP methyl ester carboxylesterase [Arthrobacter sp. UYP6]|uniref:hypothetical protein n=1 Tax=Arthrobacter sp. UYP6 TaxID=1756378 RepID=UPI0033924972
MAAKWAGEGSASGIRVRGGSHGLTVEFRELERVADALQGVVSRLADLRAECTEMYLLLNGTSAVHRHAHQAAAAAEHVIRGLQRNMAELEEAAADLREAAGNYLDVEGRMEDALARLRFHMGLAMWNGGGWAHPGRTPLDFMMPEQEWIAIKVVMGLLAEGRYGKLRPIEVTKVEAGLETVRVSGTAQALLERSKVLLDGLDGTDRGGTPGPGVVEILTGYRHGKPVRIVTLPGTQNSGTFLVGPNPFDFYGNAEGRAEDSRYVADAVAEALRQAGASAGDEVILVGYSQGGIHAVNTGARLAEDGRFSVEMVVTAGAPAGDRNIPDGVRVLNFEHERDWVPGLDGSSNPDTPDRVTVSGTSSVDGWSDGGLGRGHDLDMYLDLADQADRSEDPSLKDSLGYLSEIILPGTITTRSLFRFSRKSSSKPQGPMQPPGETSTLPHQPLPPPGAGPLVPRPFLPLPGAGTPLLPPRPGQ